MKIAILLLLIFLILLTLRVPIGVSMALSSLVGFLMIGFNLNTVGSMVYTAIASNSLMSIPGYILAGAIMGNGGISKHLLNALRAWIGHIPGGIAIVTVLACGFFAAITGSSSATIAAIGGMMIPAMVESNYNKPFAMGLVASAGSLGILIPPSIPMILYATVSEQSIGKLFAAGMVPGLLVMALYTIYIITYTLKKKQGQLPKAERTDRLKLTVKALPGAMLPVFILGGIYSGAMTPTESSAFASFYALFVSFVIYREYSVKKFAEAVQEAAKSTATIMFIVTACSMFSLFLTTARVPHQVLEIVASSKLNVISLVMICNLIILVLGCFMDGVSIMLIAAPLMVPIVSSLGYNLIQFGIVMTIGIQLGQLTPPVGMNLFMVSGMEKEAVTDVMKGSLPFTLLLLIVLILVTVVPHISLLAAGVVG